MNQNALGKNWTKALLSYVVLFMFMCSALFLLNINKQYKVNKNKGTAHILLFRSVLKFPLIFKAEFRINVRTTKCNILGNTKGLNAKFSKIFIVYQKPKRKEKRRFVISMIVYA